MKKFLRFCVQALSHFVLILSVMLLVLLVLDQINPSMAFLAGIEAKCILGALCVFSLLQSFLFLFGKEK